jgi:ATP-dependent helicase/nuclease subunit A
MAPAPDDLTRPVEPRLIGTATHLVISHLDLACPVTKESIEKTIEKLLADSAITASVAECIDTESILAFFESELGKIVLDSGNTVLRDWSFTFAFSASEFPFTNYDFRFAIHDSQFTNHEPRTTSDERRATRDETIVVQGIIDMLVQTSQGLIVIDFKTDDISAGQVTGRAELYRQQLNLYARAASAILKSESIAKWLYFLTPARAFEIKD